MITYAWLWQRPAYLLWPRDFWGWLGWFAFLAVLAGAAWELRKREERLKDKRQPNWVILSALVIAVPLLEGVGGLTFPLAGPWGIPGVETATASALLPLLGALPWVLAAGISGGPMTALGLGMLSGLLGALWGSHSLYAVPETAGMALFFAVLVQQDYRTGFFRFCRHPAGAALIAGLVFSPVYLLGGFLEFDGTLALRMDYALTGATLTAGLSAASVLIAGLLAEVFAWRATTLWTKPTDLRPSPYETSLAGRFLGVSVPVILCVALALGIAVWFMAQAAVNAVVEERIGNVAKVCDQNLSYFLESGQAVIQDIAASLSTSTQPGQISADALSTEMRKIGFFESLKVVNPDGMAEASYPTPPAGAGLSMEEQTALPFAFSGVPLQRYFVPSMNGDDSASIAYVVPLKDEAGQVRAALIGRASLSGHPLLSPSMAALDGIQGYGGNWDLLDEDGRVLMSSIPGEGVLSDYGLALPNGVAFRQGVSSTGARALIFSEVWSRDGLALVASVPFESLEGMVLQAAFPLYGLLLVLAAGSVLGVTYAIRHITHNLSYLSGRASQVAGGVLDPPIDAQGEDEVGQLALSLEQMRLNLKRRLEELQWLLRASESMGGRAPLEQKLSPALGAGLWMGASLARCYVTGRNGEGEHDGEVMAGAGPLNGVYAYLDAQLAGLAEEPGILLLPSTVRSQTALPHFQGPRPGAIMALALKGERHGYGVYWLGYEKPHAFSQEEIDFAKAISNEVSAGLDRMRLLEEAENERERLKAILEATPDAVLFFDASGRLILVNQAASALDGVLGRLEIGAKSEEILQNAALQRLLQEAERTHQQAEIALDKDIMVRADITPVYDGQRFLGKMCLLSDISRYKQLDELKSDFVATVSHDLRAPLTLVKGYLSMLPMVGGLSEQQSDYLERSQQAVETVSHLVDNLLDMKRMENAGQLSLELFDAGVEAQSVLDELRPFAVQRGIELSLRTSWNEMLLQADRALIHQGLVNLVDNAVKFSPMRGVVEVRVEQNADVVTFVVEDHGAGISPLDLPHIFEGLDESSRRDVRGGRGTHMGLAITKLIAERHGGRVWAESRLGKGSTFYLEIPRGDGGSMERGGLAGESL